LENNAITKDSMLKINWQGDPKCYFCDQNEKISLNVWIDLGQNVFAQRRQIVCLWRRNNILGYLNYRDHLSCLHFK
jgi:hypothetical protein